MDRRQKMLVSTLTSVFLALACFLLILAISNDFQKSWDITANQRHSFSQQTVDMVSGLKQEVKLYAFVNPSGDSSVIENLLDRYRKLSPRNFSYDIVDLQKNPTLADTMQVRSYGQGVLEKVEELPEGATPRRERILTFDEASITNGLTKLLRSEEKSTYFIVGHGERRPDQQETREMGQLVTSLKAEGYSAKALNLAETPEIPEDASLVVMAGPTGDLLAKEKEILLDYLNDSGKLFFMIDLETPDSYNELLGPFGFSLSKSVIVDEQSAQVGAEPVTPIGVQYSPEHPITEKFQNITAFTLARPVELKDVDLESKTGEPIPLVKTGQSAYLIPLSDLLSGQSVAFSADGKQPGAYTLAAAGLYKPFAEATPTPTPTPQGEGNKETEPPTKSTRIVVSSSADTFSNAYLGQATNRDFCLNAINWLAESENQITVRAKDPEVQPITLPQQTQNWLYFFFCLLIPFLSAFTGILITYYRRQGKAS